MKPVSVALVDGVGHVGEELMSAAVRALNLQIARDLAAHWPVCATVASGGAGAGADIVVRLVASLAPGDSGRQRTPGGPLVLKVLETPAGDEWTEEASRQLCEVLVETSGARTVRTVAVGLGPGGVVDLDTLCDFVVSVCAPCVGHGYEIDGVLVSDFVTPRFYDPAAIPDMTYSFTGALRAPRRVLPGGWLAWIDPQTAEVSQLLHVDPEAPPRLRALGRAPDPELRDFVDSRTQLLVRANRTPPSDRARRARREARASACPARENCGAA